MMRFLIKYLFISLLFLMGAVFLLQMTPQGRDLLDRAERIARMGTHQLFYRWKRPLPSTPTLRRLKARLADKGLRLGDPIFMRIFKKEAKLEIWMRKNGRFTLFSSYPICYFSGRFGPKLKQGDRQAPEGFYTVAKHQLNPHSRWHRSFNLGYPNLYDRAHGRTGNYLMVHGGCSSIGCYAMTNDVIDEIWAIVTAALDGDQRRFHVHAYPFHLTARNLRRYKNHKWAPFWRDLQKGYEQFEASRIPPRISVCKGRYQTRPGPNGSTGSTALRRACLREAQL